MFSLDGSFGGTSTTGEQVTGKKKTYEADDVIVDTMMRDPSVLSQDAPCLTCGKQQHVEVDDPSEGKTPATIYRAPT